MYLIQNQNLTKSHAYDIARKEFYQYRHKEDVERQMAREEALATGAYFNIGPNEIAAGLEDAAYEKWKVWASTRHTEMKLRRAEGYSGSEVDDDADLVVTEFDVPEDAEVEAEEAVPEGGREAVVAAINGKDYAVARRKGE